jgi:hypothetical protein
VLEVLDEVTGQPQLRRGDGMAPRELERERRLAVVEDEPVVLRQAVARLPGAE